MNAEDVLRWIHKNKDTVTKTFIQIKIQINNINKNTYNL